MGYLTRFELSITPTTHENDIREKELYGLSVADLMDGGWDNYKWYDHENEMRDFSKKYPDTLFELRGEGEEAGDLWVKYFQNGKMQRCHARIEYDDFDPEKLK